MKANEPHNAANTRTESLVAELVNDFLARLDRGEKPQVAEYTERHPEIADVLHQVLSTLEVLENVPLQSESLSNVGLDGPASRSLGDFRLVREIGRGGMGIVYEAKQISLDRRVALKVLPFAAVLDNRQLQRFKNEAQAAAQLHHTNIVPVFSVGCERGVHYYAMQYVEGSTLAEVVRELRHISPLDATGPNESKGVSSQLAEDLTSGRFAPAARTPGSSTFSATAPLGDTNTSALGAVATERSTRSPAFFRSVARLGMQAAEALEHAHFHGIVHRDIKPSNLLLDSEGTLWVTDFGLAHFRTETGLTLTMPGDLLGTTRYMSPEQALGKSAHIDHRTDIYSLGTTLYELLALQPAFAGENRQQLLRKISDEDARPLRRLNDATPADLETIVLKAMEKEPQARYSTAQELSDDLQRFLQDKPIKAKRPSVAERLMKWSRRHRTVVLAAFAVLAIAVAALSVSTLLIWREQRRTQSALQRAGTNFQKAREAVEEMTRVADRQLVNVPGTEQVRRDLLEKAQIFYREFVEEEISNDPRVRQEMGRAYKRLADIHQMLGEFKQAEQAFRQAISIFEALSTEFPTVPEYRRDLGSALFWLGVLLKNYMADKQEALKVYQRSFELRAELVDEFPTVPEYLSELAHSHVDLGLVLRDLARHEEALPEFHQGLGLRAQLASRFPDVFEYREALAHSHHWLGACLKDVGQLEEAERHYRQCLALRKELAKGLPDSAKCQHDLAHIQNYLARLLVETGQSEEAVKILQEAAAIGEELVAGFPKFHEYWWRVSSSYEVLAEALADTGHSEEAEEKLRQCLSLKQRLVSDCPGDHRYWGSLCGSYHKLGLLLQATNRLAEAEQAYLHAIELLGQMVADFPQVPKYGKNLTETYRSLGDVLEKMGRVDEAREAYHKAQEFEKEMVTEGEE